MQSVSKRFRIRARLHGAATFAGGHIICIDAFIWNAEIHIEVRECDTA